LIITTSNRTNTMQFMHDDLARTEMSLRLGAARDIQRGHQLAVGRRLSSRADRAAKQARLSLARML